MDVRPTFSKTSVTPACHHSPETSPLLIRSWSSGTAGCRAPHAALSNLPAPYPPPLSPLTSRKCLLISPSRTPVGGHGSPEPPWPNAPGPAADAGCWMSGMLQVSKRRFPLSPTVVLSLCKVGNDRLPVPPIAVYCCFHSLQLVSLLSNTTRFS